MNQKTVTPLADIVVYDTEDIHEFAFHGITDEGRKRVADLGYGIRTQESSLRVIHTRDIDSAFDLLNEYGLVILTL